MRTEYLFWNRDLPPLASGHRPSTLFSGRRMPPLSLIVPASGIAWSANRARLCHAALLHVGRNRKCGRKENFSVRVGAGGKTCSSSSTWVEYITTRLYRTNRCTMRKWTAFGRLLPMKGTSLNRVCDKWASLVVSGRLGALCSRSQLRFSTIDLVRQFSVNYVKTRVTSVGLDSRIDFSFWRKPQQPCWGFVFLLGVCQHPLPSIRWSEVQSSTAARVKGTVRPFFSPEKVIFLSFLLLLMELEAVLAFSHHHCCPEVPLTNWRSTAAS